MVERKGRDRCLGHGERAKAVVYRIRVTQVLKKKTRDTRWWKEAAQQNREGDQNGKTSECLGR